MRDLTWFKMLLLAMILSFGVPVLAPSLLPSGIAQADDDDDDDDGDDDSDDDDDDDDDDDFSVRRPEFVIAGLDDAARARLQARGFRVAREASSGLMRGQISRVEGPPGRSAASALQLLRSLAPGALAARNDLFRRYALSRYRPMGEPCRERCETFEITAWQPSMMSCAIAPRIGVIDTRVDTSHPSLAGAQLTTMTVRRQDRRPSDAEHGTGVVSLLVGQPGTAIVGVLPRASVLAVDAFHREGNGDSADVFDLVAGLDWLVDNGARVINLSFSGPGNTVMAEAIARVTAQGVSVVAAAGRPDGGASGYPARYDGVLAVSAVDVRLRPSRLSSRGTHIAFAAPGVGIVVAGPRKSHRQVDGTSFAAPFVTAAVAMSLGGNGSAADASDRLRAQVKDLGAPGRDPVFGWGLVQFQTPQGC